MDREDIDSGEIIEWWNKVRKSMLDRAYNQALEDVLNCVEWDGYTLDIKERIESLKK